QLGERSSLCSDQMHHLEGGEDPVSGRVVLAEDHVAGRLAAEEGAGAHHLFPNVSVADPGAYQADAVASEGRLETAVRHDRANDEPRVQLPMPGEVSGRERQNKVAVVHRAARVHGDDAVAVAVKRETDVGL